MSQNNSFKKDSPEVAGFLNRQPLSDRLNSFKQAFEKPDGAPPVVTQPEATAVAPVPIRQLQPQEVEQVDQHSQALDTRDQRMALEIPEAGPAKNGRPLHGKKPKVEKTFAIDDEIHSRLIEISNWEGIRHRKKFSVSFVMSHLLEFALAHVEGTKVIPIDGAEGLVIPTKGA